MAKRSTIYFEPEIHRALRLKAAINDRSISDLVNDAVRHALAEDEEDLAAFQERAAEPTITYEALLADLKSCCKLQLPRIGREGTSAASPRETSSGSSNASSGSRRIPGPAAVRSSRDKSATGFARSSTESCTRSETMCSSSLGSRSDIDERSIDRRAMR